MILKDKLVSLWRWNIITLSFVKYYHELLCKYIVRQYTIDRLIFVNENLVKFFFFHFHIIFLLFYFRYQSSYSEMVIIINHEIKSTTKNNGLIRKESGRKMYWWDVSTNQYQITLLTMVQAFYFLFPEGSKIKSYTDLRRKAKQLNLSIWCLVNSTQF